MRTRRVPMFAAVAAAALTVLAGCTSDLHGASGAMAARGTAGAGDAAASPAQPGKNSAPEQAVVAAGDRRLVRSASVQVQVDDVTTAAREADRQAHAVGGFTSQEDLSTARASVSLRVPGDKFDAFLSGLGSLGTVTGRSQSTQDVTDQYVDVRSRVTSQRASVQRIRALLARAQSISDITQVEAELSRREADLESLEQRSAALTDQVALGTVTLQLSARPVAPPPTANTSGGFTGGLAAGWHAFLGFGRGAGTVAGAALPFLLGIGVPAVLVLWVVRRRRTRPVDEAPAAG